MKGQKKFMTDEENIIFAAAVDEEKYDNFIKKLLMMPRILATILKATVEEYDGLEIDEIIPCITDLTDMRAVDPTSVAASLKMDTEESSLSDKLIRYDIHLKLPAPAGPQDARLFLFIDLEAQNESRESVLGYPIEKRALYYVARELSSQLGVLTSETDYGVLQKCYSIWICNTNLEKDRDTVTRYTIGKNCEIGRFDGAKENYDMMEVVIIRRGRTSNTEGIFDLLNGVFTSDFERINRRSGIEPDDASHTQEDTKMMSGFAKSIAIEHEEIGEARGEARGEGRLAKLISILISLGRTDDVAKAANDEEARKEFYREFNIID